MRGDAEIFSGYADLGPYSAAFDEMFDRQGRVRAPYKGIYAELAPTGNEELGARAEALGRAFVDQGITFALSGQEERPFPLDLVPRVISAAEWSKLEAGITQRVVALERFLDDIYGDQAILRDGVLPRRLVTSCEHFHREAAGISPPNAHTVPDSRKLGNSLRSVRDRRFPLECWSRRSG